MSKGAARKVTIVTIAMVLGLACTATSALASNGAISGTISSGGTGIAGTVVVYEGGGFDTEVQTASNGTYSVSLPEGSYQLDFFADGNYLSQYYDDKSSLAGADAVKVTGGATTSGIDAELQVGGQIEGKLTDSTGAPLGDGYAYVYNGSGEFVDLAFTSESGTYDVEQLPTGAYTVEFKRYAVGGEQIAYYKGQSSKAAATAVHVTAGTATSGIDEVLPALGKIAGTVSDSEGHLLAEVNVELLSGTSKVAAVKTSASGTYTFNEVLPGAYHVKFVPAEGSDYLAQYYQAAAGAGEAKTVTVSSGASTGSIDAHLQTAGEITGTVQDTLGVGLGGVQVELYKPPGTFPVAYATSATGGSYSLPGLESGSYQLEFTDSGYEDTYYAGRTTLAGAESVSVTTGAVSGPIDVRMPPAAHVSGAGAETASGEIAGVVSAPGGGGVEGVVVTVSDQHGHQLGRASTLANGTYSFNALPSGEYGVRFDPGPGEDLAPQVHSGPVSVTEGAITFDVDAQMRSGGTIAGVVQSSSGTALADIEVDVYRDGELTPEEVASTVSAGDGSYSIGGLAAGSYLVRFANAFQPAASWVAQYYADQPTAATAKPVTVSEGATTAGVDASLVAGGTLSGTVRDSAQSPVAGVRVEVLQSDGAYVSGTDSEAGGSWSVGNLPAGGYLVRFVPAGMNLLATYYPGAATQAAAQPVSLATGAAVGGIDATLAQGSSISGTDTLGFSFVSIFDTGGNLVAKLQTNGSGEYEALGLPAGEYVVRFEPLSYQNDLAQYYKEASTFAAATVLSVSPAAPATGVDPYVEGHVGIESGAQITGTVTDEGGHPLAGIQVRAYGAEEAVAASTATIANGTYTLVGLPAGSYRLEFQSEAGLGYATGYYKQAAALAAATPVVLTIHQSLGGIDEKLAPGSSTGSGGSIEGTVTDQGGGALGGVEVLALAPSGEAIAAGTSSSDGTYAIAGLPAGGYDVEFEPSGAGELTQFYPGAVSRAQAQAVQVSAGGATAGIDAQIKSIGAVAALGGGLSVELASTTSSGTVQSESASASSSAAHYVGGRKVSVRGGLLKLALACAAQSPCGGSVALSAYVNKHGAVVTKPGKGVHTVTLASASYSLAAAGKLTLAVHLSAAAQRLLSTHRGGLAVHLAVRATGASAGPALTLTLSSAPAKSRPGAHRVSSGRGGHAGSRVRKGK